MSFIETLHASHDEYHAYAEAKEALATCIKPCDPNKLKAGIEESEKKLKQHYALGESATLIAMYCSYYNLLFPLTMLQKLYFVCKTRRSI